MASMLKLGSSGSEVKKLQELLNATGYNLAVDGVFGAKTQSAVRKYQKANGLGVDGIVGDETWGSLNGGTTNPDADATVETPKLTTPLQTEYDPTTTTANQADLSMIEGSAPTYTQSQAYKDALSQLQAWQNQKPGAYSSPYADKISQLYDQIVNRGSFEYDFNADPIYQQYKDRYIQNGQRAMQDTTANAAALTGGYGNSYAATAGNLAYQQYLSGLNDVIPQLYDSAYSRWADEGTQLLNNLSTTQGLDETAYGRYRDNMSDYYDQLSLLADLENQQYGRDYGQYQDAMSKYLADREYYYGKAQDDLAQSNLEAQLAASTKSSSSGSSSSSSSKTSGGTSSTSGGQSSAYKTVLGVAKNLSASKAKDYLSNMVSQGAITQSEANYIYSVELAGTGSLTTAKEPMTLLEAKIAYQTIRSSLNGTKGFEEWVSDQVSRGNMTSEVASQLRAWADQSARR